MIGLLNIHKPAGLTSRDVVNHVQRLARPDKVGHAGTLDPLATGVLVVGVGRATRLVPFIQQLHKTYRATFLLGRTSDTDDVEGRVIVLEHAPTVTRQQVLAALPRFVGRIEQVPPQFSAVKVQGERAYDLARAGLTADIKPRLVDVYRLELLTLEPPELSLEIECGSGTYVRSIGRDLGARLGTGAVMCGLVRTRIGPFRIEQALMLDEINRDSLAASLLPAACAVTDHPRCLVDSDQAAHLRHGRSIPFSGMPDSGGAVPLAVIGPQGELMALAAVRNGRLCPTLVLAPGNE